MFKKSLLSLALFSAASIANANVLTTIKPLGFISAAITEGVTETQVLLPTSASPHDYSLKPSDVEKLKSAQLVVWVGDEMETFLEKTLDKLPKEKVLTLEDVEQIKTLVESHKKEHDEHEHEHAHKHEHKHKHEHGHDHDEHHHDHDEDWHIWLSPIASETIAEQIAERLSQLMPEHKAKIAENLSHFKTALATKHAEIEKQLTSAQGKGYYTFHDAYRYFESAYHLNPLGSFTINPSVAPGAKTLAKIKKHLTEHKAQCLFAEPQFTPKVIESLSKGTAVQVGQLDPLGAKIELSQNAYPQFLQNLADQFSQCLAK
ncbi:High-affinity zinc uptake system protein znuA [Bibersteinia trehalosi USDA-ARS-USMARC-188]|uniref:High-affinity zinc uptake system protein ZnuA n=1 Tax=Bibersteinia trehalosi USDA-ARS-USMARC-188 TaxID=1263829 RepID=A0A4V7IC27_BIBTR|nr:zinc ABC transporter substrate-binding protein ZnuA [Bibersteinia trehalosi]AHG82482.1 High-affinity zinc uptake system protein znuA [Bibersteinia trehalosi USDA-ARS-USMARC-188]